MDGGSFKEKNSVASHRQPRELLDNDLTQEKHVTPQSNDILL